MEKQLFIIKFKSNKLIGDIIPEGVKPNVLILHGSGKSNRLHYDYIRFLLAEDGIATCAFDFIGHGETGGDIKSTSLKDRTQQAAAIIDQLKLSQPLGLLGGSMGAYTAIKLTELYKVDRLVLVVPAVYSKGVYTIPFGEDLTERLREKEGWKDSDAWSILEKFSGKLLIGVAQNDEIIPREIPERIYAAARNAKSSQIFVSKNAPHKIREYLLDPKNQSMFQEYYALVRQVLIN